MSGKNKKGSGMKFYKILLLIGIVPMMISVTAMAVMMTEKMKAEIKEGVVNELMVAAKQVDAYFIYDVIANGYVDYDEYSDHEYIESLQEEGIELTLFEKDTRFLTSLKNDAGEYMEGTQASPEIYAQVSAGEPYSGENVVINGNEYFVYYRPIYDGNGDFWGMAFAGEREEKVQTAIRSAILQIVRVAEGLTVLFIVIIVIVGLKISKKVNMIADNINVLADGRLDADFNIDIPIAEMAQLANSGDILQQQLRQAVGGVKSSATNLGDVVVNVNKLLGNSADGTAIIRQTVSEMAETAQNMAITVENTSHMMIDMGNSIDEITDNIARMNRNSDASMEANRTATEYMRKLEYASEKTTASVSDISAKIAECSEAAEKIKSATDAITEISSQTNLLSLNASIEAARAGEAGRGFAVVASEIQKLAEQSSSSATDIQGVINGILAKVTECVTKAEEMNEIIKEQVQFLDETKGKIADMSDAGSALAEGTRLIDKEALRLKKLKEEVISAVSDLAAISEENAASSCEVSTSVDGVSSAVDSTKNESNSMRILAEELDERMRFFKI